ncbi:hypothetical protein [Nonomuraea maritima]|uniref:hypothetical protein n=1 Tax=Nonomuraea maritima TaxID=683260 RepID=UPI0037191C87
MILTTFGVGRHSVGWFCSVMGSASHPMDGPYALETVPGELLFWGVLLLPVIVAGLLLRGSRRAALAAIAAVGAVLTFGLVTALFLPGLDPCTGEKRAVVLPWPLLVCYPMAAGALLSVARMPLPGRPYATILWAGAAGAAGWVAMFDRRPAYEERGLTVVYMRIPESFWDGLAWWSGEANAIGFPVVLVVLAAAATATVSMRWEHVAGTAAAAVLLLFPLLDVAMYISRHSGDFGMSLADCVRWPLLVAAVLVASATWSRQVRVLARSMTKQVVAGRAKGLAVAAVVAVGGIWLIVSSFTPTR